MDSNRSYRKFYSGGIYHIYNRGNHKQNIFFDNQDYNVFLNRVQVALGQFPIYGRQSSARMQIRPLPRGAISVLTYTPMANHFHFALRQNIDIGIDRFMSKVCTSYAKYFNKKYERVGHLWQDRFKSKLITTDANLLQLAKYICKNRNNYKEFPFSGFYELYNQIPGGICDHELLLSLCNMTREQFLEYIDLN